MSKETQTEKILLQEILSKKDLEKVIALYHAFKNTDQKVLEDIYYQMVFEIINKHRIPTEIWSNFRKNHFENCLNIYIAEQEKLFNDFQKRYQA
ncbi:hypothetical protein G8C15_10730 [Enterococcus casseliflavus]|nr:hypothetical protein [Enterococcus casseliflavus]MBF0015169.1 hypothetical protein [Enterococcus casseliflavus]